MKSEIKHRKALTISTVVVIVLAILVVVGLRLVDVIAKSVIDGQVTAILGVESTVGGVSLGVLTSRSSFTDITVKNPTGFEYDYILSVERAEIDCGIGTLMSDDIDIPRMLLEGLHFDLEQIDDRINLEILIKHIQEYMKSLPPSSSSTELMIHELEVTNVHLTAKGKIVTAAGGTIDEKIPDFTVKNIGTTGNTGQMTSQFVSILTHVVMSRVFKHPIDGLSNVTVSSINSVLGKIPIFEGLKGLGGILSGDEKDKPSASEPDKGKD
ncbi:MAG: AsmA family protein [Phycisphaerales bacterium]|nr:AsmA family protein [Phycisphaerales bacterium]